MLNSSPNDVDSYAEAEVRDQVAEVYVQNELVQTKYAEVDREERRLNGRPTVDSGLCKVKMDGKAKNHLECYVETNRKAEGDHSGLDMDEKGSVVCRVEGHRVSEVDREKREEGTMRNERVSEIEALEEDDEGMSRDHSRRCKPLSSIKEPWNRFVHDARGLKEVSEMEVKATYYNPILEQIRGGIERFIPIEVGVVCVLIGCLSIILWFVERLG